MKVYTFGYEKRKADELVSEVMRLGATVIDVRIKPFSRAKGWSRKSLEAVLGDDYRWVEGFGNKNYKGGPIELVDAEAGCEQIADLVENEIPVILLCYEKDWKDCHRTDVAEAIVEKFGGEIEHLVQGDAKPTTQYPIQLSLF